MLWGLFRESMEGVGDDCGVHSRFVLAASWYADQEQFSQPRPFPLQMSSRHQNGTQKV
jgi:hypothetical protein